MEVSDITPLSSETKLYEYLDEFETHVVNEIVYCISQMHLEQNQKEKKIEFQEKTHDAVSSFLSPTPLLWMCEISSWIYTQWWRSRSVQGTLDGATYSPLECRHLGRFSLVLRIVETRQCCYFVVYVTARLRQLPYYVGNASLHAIWELSYRVRRASRSCVVVYVGLKYGVSWLCNVDSFVKHLAWYDLLVMWIVFACVGFVAFPRWA